MPDVNAESVLKKGLRTIARGFLLGVGFGIAMLGAFFIMWHVAENSSAAAMTDIKEEGQATAIYLVISDVRETNHHGVDLIVGTVKNTGKKSAHGVQIQADLFAHGKFVDQYSTYLSGAIEPGASKNFKISCGCKDSPPAEHDSYKLEVTSSGF